MKINNNIKSPKKFNVEDLLNFLAEELQINDDIELTVIYNDRLLDRLSKEYEFKALLYCAMPNHYILAVRENVYDLKHILCHEMVHLQQYCSGKLKISEDFKKVWWLDEEFDNSISYNDRGWEEEAFSKQHKLWKKFKKSK